MKITFLLPYAGISGGVRVVGVHAERLQRRGHDVEIISLPTWLRGRRELLKDFLTRRLPLRLRGEREPSLLEGFDVEHRVLERWRPITNEDVRDGDAVVATWWETAQWAKALSPAKGAKVYFLQGYDTLTGQPAEKVDPTWRLPMHKIVVSQCLADIARDTFGDCDVSLVPNGVDHEQFHAPPRGKQPAPTVGLLYSYKSYRGCEVCIEAARLAAKKLPNLRMITFSMGFIVPECPLPEFARYIHLPPQEELRTIYASCDAWLFGSRFEGFGLPILEAMACRTPVIATPAGAAPQLLAGGGGALVPRDDPHTMADALVRLLTLSDDRWRQVSDAAHATSLESDWERSTDMFEAALERAVHRGEKRTALSVA